MRIALQNVWFRYLGSSSFALRSIDLEVREGEVVAIVGPNGSGKTTLLKVLATLYAPSVGRVLVDEVNFWSLSEDERTSLRRRLVYVHEKPTLFRGTVLDNVMLGLRLRRVRDAEKRAMDVLEALGISKLASHGRKELSAGQAQLVALARAIAVEPEVMLLDEPFAYLDEANRRRVAEVLTELNSKRGVAIAIASHVYIENLVKVTKTVKLFDGAVVEVRGEAVCKNDECVD